MGLARGKVDLVNTLSDKVICVQGIHEVNAVSGSVGDSQGAELGGSAAGPDQLFACAIQGDVGAAGSETGVVGLVAGYVDGRRRCEGAARKRHRAIESQGCRRTAYA